MTPAHSAPPAGPAPQLSGEGLVRAIGRWTMVALVINMVVGSGIFGLPARVHALVGVHGLLAYAACAIVIAGITLCVAEVASRFTTSGGPYLYTTEAFGPLPGFLIGWLMALSRMTSLAIIAGILADYLAYLWPVASTGLVHGAVMVAALVILAAINVLGVREGAGTAVAMTIGKLIPLVLFVAIGVFFMEPHRFVAGTSPSGSSFTQAVLALVFAFSGFESAVATAGEMKDPSRDAPFSLLVGIGVTTLLYVLIQTVCIGTLPDLANSKRPLADAAAHFAGAPGGATIAIAALVSTFGALGGAMLAGPRVLFAMAERGQAPPALGRLHPRFRTPSAAIVLLALGGIALSLSGTFSYLLGLNVLARLAQYGSTALALLVLRRRSQPAPFVVRGALLVVPLTVIACVWLIARSSARELRDIGIALVFGVVVYAALAAWRARPGAGGAAPTRR